MRIEDLTAEQLLVSIWTLLGRIETNMALPPAPLELPAINVAPPDLTDIVAAVTSLNGTGPTADDIARAIASVLPSPSGTEDEALRAVAEGLKLLDHRLQGFGKQAYGGGTVSMAPNTTFGVSGTVSTLEGTGLVPKVYDYISLGYTGSDLTTVVYKTGGSGGTTVATLTLTYSASVLQSVART